MADPRKTSEYTGIDSVPVTFKIDDSTITFDADAAGGSAVVGRAVKLSADNVVALVGDGERVHGKLLLVESDGYCTVQTDGYCELPGGNGATLTVGGPFAGALNASSAAGFIKTLTTAGIARGTILDNDDTTRVKVKLSS